MPTMADRVPVCATRTDAVATGPMAVAAANAMTAKPSSDAPQTPTGRTCSRRRCEAAEAHEKERQQRGEAGDAADGDDGSGERAAASPSSTGSMPQMSAQSSAQPAPAVARRPPRRPVSSTSAAPSTRGRPRRPRAAGRPTARPLDRLAEARWRTTAPKPPPRAASGPTIESLPTASALSKAASARTSIGPLRAARPAARHSSRPSGRPMKISHAGTNMHERHELHPEQRREAPASSARRAS